MKRVAKTATLFLLAISFLNISINFEPFGVRSPVDGFLGHHGGFYIDPYKTP